MKKKTGIREIPVFATTLVPEFPGSEFGVPSSRSSEFRSGVRSSEFRSCLNGVAEFRENAYPILFFKQIEY